jgi:DNA polymerase-1
VSLSAKTATGKMSVAKDVLGEIDHPIARDVLRARYVHRVRLTYLGALLKSAGGEIGRSVIHPSINPIEARTGRMSVNNPPMQQLPRDNPLARNGIVPRAEGEVLVTADYGQIELRMWARLTRDEALASVLRTADETGGDFFVEVGKDVYSKPDFEKADPRRTLIKNVTYGTIYGAGVPTMAASAGVAEEVMDPIAAALKEHYPSFRTLGMDLIQQGSDDGRPYWSVASPFAREIKVRRRDEARKLPNYLDQGSSAVVLKQALLNADAAGLGDFLMLPVHDEVLLSVPKQEAKEASMALKQCMETAANQTMDTFGVLITADPSEPGDRWGNLKK